MSARRKSVKQTERGVSARVVSPARLAAFNILRRVEEEGAYASLLLAASETAEMRADDRALCYELVLGTLRRQLWLDRLMEHYAGRNSASLDAPVRRALRLGLYQLRFLSRIPASAVVNESVNLAYVSRLRSAAAFINAVLRRATREPDYDPAADVADPLERLSVETSHPAWLIERWVKAFGRDEAEAFARANNEAPPHALRIIARRASEEEVLSELRAAGGVAEPSQVAPTAWRVQGAAAVLQRLALEGKIYLQDEASQLVAHVLDARAGERVLDVCAAPGSKTTHIAARTPDLSIIVAGDLHEHRARQILKAATRQGVEHLSVVVHDAENALPYAESSFDRVLVDAPCTGTGTLRHNPEIRWRISAQDILDLSRRQRGILAGVARMVRPLGRLVYSTCSVEPEENEEVVAHFLDENNTFKQVAVNTPPEISGEDGAARTWPHKSGADGFFIAAFERRS
ncbi:MAG: rRNA (cytosine967-C5)-methyltransferase [Acidobacteriota bacterium]|jgi:16S rRNA (cytosine967-C5)-methyltransferase|nr:rRNA (cytosine967-C5)-methyltransferase [Acidobacteriota bacterium]